MTISSTVRKAGPFDGTGSQTEFPFEFKVFSVGDLYVVQYNEATGVETVLELDSDYTVTLNADQDNDPGGTIELTSALAVNYTLTITSSLANLQPTDLTNRGGFYPSVINDALDRACIQIQQLQDETDRTLKTAVSVPDGVDNTLPMPAANMVIGWDNTGVALKNWSVNDLVTSMAYGSAKANIFEGDGETVEFTLDIDPASIYNLDVSVGGVCQVPSTDYTWVSGKVVTFTVAPPEGELILIRYMQALAQVDLVDEKTDHFTGTGSQTVFALSAAPIKAGNSSVFVGGVRQYKGTYAVVGDTLTFSEAPPYNTAIEVNYL